MDELRYIEQLVDSDFKLAAVDTSNPQRIVSLFGKLSRVSGKAVYLWSEQEGLYRLGAEHVVIPQTRRPEDVLDYVLSSIHYGIYLLPMNNEALKDFRVAEALKRVATTNNDRTRRLVVLLGHGLELPKSILPLTVRMRHAMRDTA